MSASLLLRLAGCVVHADTLARIVEPAVADLQFETAEGSPGSMRTRLSGCAGVVRALAGAVWLDLVWDARQPAWAHELAELTNLALVVAAYQLAMGVLIMGFYAPLHRPLKQWLAGGLSNGTLSAAAIIVFATAACALAGRAHSAEPVPGDGLPGETLHGESSHR